MLTLTLILVAAGAAAGTASLVYAVKTAPQGYEDDTGFHLGEAARPVAPRAMSGLTGKGKVRRPNAALVISPPPVAH